jgi:hypothetical protein
VSIIKKIIITVIILALVVTGFVVFTPFNSEPPTPNVTVGNTEIPTTQGSYCWKGFLSAQCVDMVYSSPLDMAKNHKPTIVSPNKEIKVDFEIEPIAGTLEVEQWSDKDNVENVEMKYNNSIVAPKEKGIYVYHVKANWKQGSGNYTFSIEVK